LVSGRAKALIVLFLLLSPIVAMAQLPKAQDSTEVRHSSGSANYRARLALGFVASIAAHESAHFIASWSVGARPSVGFDRGRPTVYSGIVEAQDPHKQLLFSAAA
jgi:hypothetical protein